VAAVDSGRHCEDAWLRRSADHGLVPESRHLRALAHPYPTNIRADDYKNAPRHNYIDDYILKHLQVLHIAPSPRQRLGIRPQNLPGCSGILPTPAEVERFLKDNSPDNANG